jgi:hypothetical protein
LGRSSRAGRQKRRDKGPFHPHPDVFQSQPESGGLMDPVPKAAGAAPPAQSVSGTICSVSGTISVAARGSRIGIGAVGGDIFVGAAKPINVCVWAICHLRPDRPRNNQCERRCDRQTGKVSSLHDDPPKVGRKVLVVPDMPVIPNISVIYFVRIIPIGQERSMLSPMRGFGMLFARTDADAFRSVCVPNTRRSRTWRESGSGRWSRYHCRQFC